MTTASPTPLERFEAGLRRRGYELDFYSREHRVLGSTKDADYCIVPITGHGMTDLFLLQRTKGRHAGCFDIWALEKTAFNVDQCVEDIAERLRPHGSVQSELQRLADRFGGGDE